jgi:hypothetical protein
MKLIQSSDNEKLNVSEKTKAIKKEKKKHAKIEEEDIDDEEVQNIKLKKVEEHK